MNFQFSEKVLDLQARVAKFMAEHIYPLEADYGSHVRDAGGWTTPIAASGSLHMRKFR